MLNPMYSQLMYHLSTLGWLIRGKFLCGPQHPQSGLLFGLLFFHLESALRPVPLSPDLRFFFRG